MVLAFSKVRFTAAFIKGKSFIKNGKYGTIAL